MILDHYLIFMSFYWSVLKEKEMPFKHEEECIPERICHAKFKFPERPKFVYPQVLLLPKRSIHTLRLYGARQWHSICHVLQE